MFFHLDSLWRLLMSWGLSIYVLLACELMFHNMLACFLWSRKSKEFGSFVNPKDWLEQGLQHLSRPQFEKKNPQVSPCDEKYWVGSVRTEIEPSRVRSWVEALYVQVNILWLQVVKFVKHWFYKFIFGVRICF